MSNHVFRKDWCKELCVEKCFCSLIRVCLFIYLFLEEYRLTVWDPSHYRVGVMEVVEIVLCLNLSSLQNTNSFSTSMI